MVGRECQEDGLAKPVGSSGAGCLWAWAEVGMFSSAPVTLEPEAWQPQHGHLLGP